jgi:DNA-binding response OmpR family regulator
VLLGQGDPFRCSHHALSNLEPGRSDLKRHFGQASGSFWHAVPVRILVVEDDKRLASTLRRGLEAEGFAVDNALDGEQGLWLASENSYDAIVLDIMLPKVNGFQVCSRLREQGIWTPILMLTAKDGELDEAEALDTGADDYLTKPFSYVVLVAHLRALVRRGASERPAQLMVGDLVIDPAARTCSRGGRLIELTAKEFSIVEFLARRSGEVVSKTDLLEHAWDFAYDGDPNVIEVHMSNIRRKIDKPFHVRSLRTVRGAGYRLVPDGR